MAAEFEAWICSRVAVWDGVMGASSSESVSEGRLDDCSDPRPGSIVEANAEGGLG